MSCKCNECFQRLGEKLEYWMERYEKDMEDKQQELNALKNAKASNLAQLQDLAKKVSMTRPLEPTVRNN